MNSGSQYRMTVRRFGLGASSLHRGSDRIEAATLWLALLVSLLLLPAAAALGTAVHETTARSSAELRATGTQVVARTLDATPITPSSTVVVSYPVRAEWTDATGVGREGVVRAPQGTRAGTVLRVWLDRSGTPVEPPQGQGVGAALGTLAGLAAFVGGLAGIWFLVWLVRVVLDQWRLHRWQVEWQQMSPEIHR